MDEDHAYRLRTPVLLRQGCNTVPIKAPFASFTGRDRQHPVKWMLTFVVMESV